MNWLTRREQLVLVMVLFLFILGWTVRIWRQSEGPARAGEVIER
jgi:hypothetical protein